MLLQTPLLEHVDIKIIACTEWNVASMHDVM